MGNHQTAVLAENKDGEKFSVSHTSTDSPILPAANLAQLHAIDPSLVEFVVEQTKQEAEHRRFNTTRNNLYVFIERIAGVVSGLLVAIFGLSISGYLIYLGHEWAGTAVGGGMLATIVAVFVTRQHPPEQNTQPPPTKRRSRK